MTATVGFVGLGVMGQPMAQNVLNGGFPLVVFNRTPSRATPLVERGARQVDSAEAVAEASNLLVTMLADSAAVEAVVFGQDGILDGLRPGSVLIDMSTGSPDTARNVAAAVRQKGADFLEVPVSGSVNLAQAGTLTLVAGGREDTFERCRPLLGTMGEAMFRVGEVGMATQLKLSLNLMVAGMMQVLAESLVLGVKAGLNPTTMLEVINASAVRSPLYSFKGEALCKRDFSTTFTLKNMIKDLNLILASGEKLGVFLPTTGVVKQLFVAAQAQGKADQDWSAVVTVLERIAGVEVKG